MKIRNCLPCASDVFRKFLGALRFVVADPIHQIVEFPSPDSGIEDTINLELR